jgi:hypothetical protein
VRKELKDRFDHAYAQISNPRFLNKEAIGGEVPFYICSYPPEQETDAQRLITSLNRQLNENGVKTLCVDLLELSLDILERRTKIERLYRLEERKAPELFVETVQSLLDMERHLVPALEERMTAAVEFRVLLLTGIGSVYPFVRSHNLLNNMQRIAKDAPTVLFFPGTYTGTALKLFDTLQDDNYYRAFDLVSLNL